MKKSSSSKNSELKESKSEKRSSSRRREKEKSSKSSKHDNVESHSRSSRKRHRKHSHRSDLSSDGEERRKKKKKKKHHESSSRRDNSKRRRSRSHSADYRRSLSKEKYMNRQTNKLEEKEEQTDIPPSPPDEDMKRIEEDEERFEEEEKNLIQQRLHAANERIELEIDKMNLWNEIEEEKNHLIKVEMEDAEQSLRMIDERKSNELFQINDLKMKRLSGFIYRRNGFMKSSKFLSPFLSIKNYLERNHSSLYYSHHVATSRRHVLIPEIIDELRRQPTKIAKDVDDRQLSMLKDAFQINEIIRFHFHMNSLNCMNLMKKFTRDTPLNLTQREYNDLTQQASRTSITMVNMEFLQKMKEEILINIYGERDEKKRKQLDRFNSSLNPYKSEEIDEIMNSDNQHDPSSTSFEEKLDENDRKMNFQKFHHQLISLDEPDDFQKALTMEIDKISEQTTRDKLNLSQLNESDDNYQILLEKIVRNNWSYPKDGRIYSLKDRLISSVLN